MRRRKALAVLLALGTAAVPSKPLARPHKSGAVRVVGYLSLEAAPRPNPTPEQWRARSASLLLRKAGWDEGTNLAVERAYADLHAERLPQLAEALIARGAEVIVANGPEATLAAARATKVIPIVSFNLVWPEEQGLIASFARPGGNVTGVCFYPGVEASTKRMEVLRELAPGVRRVAWLWPADYERTVSGGAFDAAGRFRSIAHGMGLELRFYPVRASADLERAFAEIVATRAQAVMASGEHAVHARRELAEFALRERLPSACPSPEVVEAGGLFSYAIGRAELLKLYTRSFEYVDRILRGARPADLPVERPDRYELAINLRTARTLGLDVPQSVLVRAGHVVD